MSSIRAIIIFLFIMWAMILLAGVIVIYVIGSISVTGYGNIDALATDGRNSMIIAWIFGYNFYLHFIKNRILSGCHNLDNFCLFWMRSKIFSC